MKCITIAASMIFPPLVAVGAIKTEPPVELRPPREAVPAPLLQQQGNRAYVLAGIGGVLVLAALCWPRRKPAPPPPDPFAVAQRELGALRADPGKATTVQVSATLRRYAVKAFELPGSAPTSEEVVSGLTLRRSCPVELVNAAWHFLSECDVVKFAPAAPPSDLQGLIGRAEKLLTDMEAARTAAMRTL